MIYRNDSLAALGAMEDERLGGGYEDGYDEERERAYDEYIDSLIDEARYEAVFGNE